MTEPPSPRQVLYGLVSGGFAVVVLILTVGAAIAGIVPLWWTIAMMVAIIGFGIWGVANWRRTAPLLTFSISLFVLWAVGTLIVN